MTGARRHVVERLLSWSAADHHFCEIYITISARYT